MVLSEDTGGTSASEGHQGHTLKGSAPREVHSDGRTWSDLPSTRSPVRRQVPQGMAWSPPVHGGVPKPGTVAGTHRGSLRLPERKEGGNFWVWEAKHLEKEDLIPVSKTHLRKAFMRPLWEAYSSFQVLGGSSEGEETGTLIPGHPYLQAVQCCRCSSQSSPPSAGGAPGEPLSTPKMPLAFSHLRCGCSRHFSSKASSARKEACETLSSRMPVIVWVFSWVLMIFQCLRPTLTVKTYQSCAFQQSCKFPRKAVRIKSEEPVGSRKTKWGWMCFSERFIRLFPGILPDNWHVT